MENVILIGKAIDFFKEEQPQEFVSFKYLLLQESKESPVKMLLMIAWEPFEYHAEGLLFYMQIEGISEIIVKGGGKIIFNLEPNEIEISGKSFAFGEPSSQEVREFIESNWKDFSIGRIPEYHKSEVKVYTLSQVQYKVDNP